MDSIGPRLTGSPANRAANDWLLRTYQAWGVDAKNEQYGTWRDWTRGPSGVQLVSPRTRVLEATMHAWSAATPAGGVTADVVIIPTAKEIGDSAGFARWLASVKGKLVLVEHAAADLPPRLRHSRSGPTRADVSARASRCATARRRLERAVHRRARQRSRAARDARARRRRRRALEQLVARLGRRQDPVDARADRSVVRRLVRGLLAARAARRRTASIRACTPSPRRRSRRTNRRCSTPSRASREQRSRTSTSCSRRISTRGTPAAARRTTAPARSRCSRRCAS